MKLSNPSAPGVPAADLVFSVGPDGAIVTGCSHQLTQAVIPSEHDGMPVTGVGPEAFRNHPYLLSVTLPATVRVIGESAFMDCHALLSVLGGAGVELVEPYAFYQCVNLRTVQLPGRPAASRTSFAGCYQLEAAGEPVTYR